MNPARRWLFCLVAVLSTTAMNASPGFAQANLPVAATGDQVVVKTEASHVIDSHKYKVPLAIDAIQTLTLVAPFDGTVKQIVLKSNAKVQAQAEVIRLNNDRRRLDLTRAQHALKIVLLEQKQADKDELTAALAQARVDLAKTDVDIAQALVDDAMIRSPIAGEVQRILISEGQYVRAGDPVAVVADGSKIKIEVPVERSVAEVGKSFSFKIEGTEVEGKVDSVLPLPSQFGVLRELFDSVASVLVVVDNPDGKFKVGQTAYVPLIPRQPVVEVPVQSVGNLPDGHRKVQVVRHMVVRDIPVSVMGQVGTTRVFVSGPFSEGDEVIYEASHQLGDAFVLKNSASAVAGAAAGATSPATTPSTPNPNAPKGF